MPLPRMHIALQSGIVVGYRFFGSNACPFRSERPSSVNFVWTHMGKTPLHNTERSSTTASPGASIKGGRVFTFPFDPGGSKADQGWSQCCSERSAEFTFVGRSLKHLGGTPRHGPPSLISMSKSRATSTRGGAPTFPFDPGGRKDGDSTSQCCSERPVEFNPAGRPSTHLGQVTCHMLPCTVSKTTSLAIPTEGGSSIFPFDPGGSPGPDVGKRSPEGSEYEQSSSAGIRPTISGVRQPTKGERTERGTLAAPAEKGRKENGMTAAHTQDTSTDTNTIAKIEGQSRTMEENITTVTNDEQSQAKFTRPDRPSSGTTSTTRPSPRSIT